MKITISSRLLPSRSEHVPARLFEATGACVGEYGRLQAAASKYRRTGDRGRVNR